MDFKDVPGVRVDDSHKKQHQVETLNILDTGSAILIANPVRVDFNASTVIESLAQVFAQWGLPRCVHSNVVALDDTPRQL